MESHRTERVSSMAVIIAVVMAVVCLAILGLDHSKKPIPAPRRSIGEPHEADDIAPENAASEHNRGRQAESPTQISLRGWKDVIVRVWRRVGGDNLALVAAGVAFYAMLAVFPALAAFVSTYALVADPHTVRQTAIELSAFLPPEAAKLLIDALSGLVDKATSKLSLGLILGVLIALWSARAGMSALMTGLNIADEEEEKRGFIDQQIVALFLTIGALIIAGVAVVALAVIPVVFALFPIGDSVPRPWPGAVADPHCPDDARARGSLSICSEPQGTEMEMGQLGCGVRHCLLALRFGGLLLLRFQIWSL